jgi:glycosyltransferase involved in cell wall biosynthesis
MKNHRVIHHFGPDPAYVGGMGSVLRVLRDYSIGGEIVKIHSTWRPGPKLNNTRLMAASALQILGMSPDVVVHIHVSEGGSFVREGLLVILARRRGLVTVITIHGASFVPFARKRARLVSMVLRHANLVTCLDPATFACVNRLAPRIRAEILPNPVPMDNDSPPADQTGELVLFAGEIGLRKGADVLCSAWRLVSECRPQARCIMVGPVHDFDVPNTDRLEVRGPISAEEMRNLLRTARVIALPSRAEGMPMILTEAMSGGRPFVSTPVGGIPDLAGEGGVMVEVGDEVGLAERLTDLLANPALARTIGERGRRFCLETRSVEVIDARLKECYEIAARRQ